jgi:DNA repair exonuclease SbcCD ATPase subunit
MEEYKSQLARQEQHYTGEIDVLKSQVARQEQHYTAEIEEYKSQLDSLHNLSRKLSRLLDNVENVAKQLSNSRRWKLANVGAVIKAKLSRGKVSTGYDPLDKIVAAYSRWRASHPEIARIEEKSSRFQPPVRPTARLQEATADDKCRQSAQSISEVAGPGRP